MTDLWPVSVVVPTFGRDAVLVDTVRAVVAQGGADEVLVVDQTEVHAPQTVDALHALEAAGRIRVLGLRPPGTVHAMNTGLQAARGGIVLFLDDDLVPGPGLVAAHARAHRDHPEAWAVAGQVLQPGCEPVPAGRRAAGRGLREDLDFDFAGNEGAWVSNVMAGNLSVKRAEALAAGGFDENFLPPVAYRFETEFAKRIVARGGRIRYEPSASVRHLRAAAGGTRAIGSHLASASPLHGVGDYYYALRCGRGRDRVLYIARRPFREVRTRFHLAHPWWIPVKLLGELRALAMALSLYRCESRLCTPAERQPPDT
jgi:GT2 family glycosyltransferase